MYHVVVLEIIDDDEEHQNVGEESTEQRMNDLVVSLIIITLVGRDILAAMCFI